MARYGWDIQEARFTRDVVKAVIQGSYREAWRARAVAMEWALTELLLPPLRSSTASWA
jgi:hypothetical protein